MIKLVEIAADVAKQAVEGRHHRKAELEYTSHIHLLLPGRDIWDGKVHVFALTDGPTAGTVSVWAEESANGIEIRSVLHTDALVTAADAVRSVYSAGLS